MNANQKKRMYHHYQLDLGWTAYEMEKYGTPDLTGTKPAEVKAVKEVKKVKEVKETKTQ